MWQPEFLAPVILMGIIFVFVFMLIKVGSDNRIRRTLIEKGLVNEDVKYLYGNRFEGSVPSSLKWGIVLTGIGLAFLIGHLVPEEMHEEVTIPAMFLFAGLGLIIYYLIGKKMRDQTKEKESKK